MRFKLSYILKIHLGNNKWQIIKLTFYIALLFTTYTCGLPVTSLLGVPVTSCDVTFSNF
jgi:hypothetical protein